MLLIIAMAILTTYGKKRWRGRDQTGIYRRKKSWN
jgi:hypothetical protein